MNFIFHFAQGFYDVGFNAAYRIKDDKSEKGFQRLPVSVINFNFAAELYLKGLHLLTTKQEKSGHEIWKLYKDLPIEIKIRIEEKYDEFVLSDKEELGDYEAKFIINKIDPIIVRDSNSLKNMLILHNKSFEEWRYLYENRKSIIFKYNFNQMNCFIKSLIIVINKIQNN